MPISLVLFFVLICEVPGDIFQTQRMENHHLAQAMEKDLKQDLKKTFNPEFLNRLSEVVVFHPLSLENVTQILDIQLQLLNEQLIQQGLTLDMTADARKWLAEKGYDKNFGARPLKRAIQKYLEDVLSDEMLKGRFKSGGVVEVGLGDDELVFTEKSGALNTVS